MKKIEFELNEDYKSFKKGFTSNLDGDLIILSGVNGAGKSQLLNILMRFDRLLKKKIAANVKIDGVDLEVEDIDFRSFKENIGIAEITSTTSQVLFNSANEAWKFYGGGGITAYDKEQYLESIGEAKDIILGKYTQEDYNKKAINEEEFKKTLRDANFIWKKGDKFSNIVGEIFFLHALKVNEKMVEVGRQHFDPKTIDVAPWTKLNDLFSSLNFDYRFKDNYELKGVEINEQPRLYPIKDDGSLNEEDFRNLKDLSDGEKTIISLCFGSLVDNTKYGKKILLLDEIDSVLNPSLIEMFFRVIEEFFLKQNILVVLSTHSSTIISLSPSYSKFYEVFKPNKTGNRILEISPSEYSELLIANKKFYDKIGDQENRILELEKKISSNEDILIVTEGKTDWKYFIAGLRFFHSRNEFENIQEDFFYKFGSDSDVESGICGTDNVNDLSESKLKNYLNFLIESRKIDVNDRKIRFGIFDSDTNISIISDSSTNVYSFKIEPNNISTELLFNDEEIKSLVNERRLYIGNEFGERNKIHLQDPLITLGGDSSNINKAGKRVIIETDVYNRSGENIALSKEKFAQAIFEGVINISEESWNNFRHIFDQISAILGTQS
ncbi:AAA family ATPase [Flavobacterium tistrianum]|uniref:AAA family ATPase n=1 Tax=Flavobacterium tistrianum TaxID=1685414 RepID=UPI000DAC8D06|nr:AAA family ATPase [Flavobacterium tistrianum]KAF2338239.1 ATP-binding protein [Flavobacterium tistrianum]